MNYLLINRKNVVVDILPDRIRYIKLQSSTGVVIACEEGEATGVIGSDANTLYVLVRADTMNSENAVTVLAVEEVPSAVVPDITVYDPDTGEFKPRYTLEEAQAMKQEENKVEFAKYLISHPMTWVDGKQYGVSQEDQSEIALNINQYQIAKAAGVDTPTLEWHAQHEECQPWSLESLTALSLAISKIVYPLYHKMQQYKTDIYSCQSIEELNAIEISYEDSAEQGD